MPSGVGYGKTTMGPRWMHPRILENTSATQSMVCAPTFKLAQRINLEYYKRFLNSIGYIEGVHYAVNNKDLFLEYLTLGKKIWFISAETWKNVVAWEFDIAWLDEPAWYPAEMFNQVVERIRSPAKVNQVLCTGVSQGVTPYYERFGNLDYQPFGTYSVEDDGQTLELTRFRLTPTVAMMHASTMENTLLPPSYIANLRDQYGWNRNMWNAHVHGLFVPITNKQFYFEFDAARHVGDCPVQRLVRPAGAYQETELPLIQSWDSNVGQMTWVAIQKPADAYWVVKENGSAARNIPEAVQQWAKAFPVSEWAHHPIIIMGDATLHQRSPQTYSTGYETIMFHLKQAGYTNITLRAHRGNPFVFERSECTNRLFARNLLKIDRSCVKVVGSFGAAESDGKGGIEKPHGDTITHPAEAVDMALVVLEPNKIRTGGGVTW